MVKLNKGLECAKVFLNDTRVLGRNTFENHLEELDEVLIQMKEAGLQINISKSKWAVKEAKYLECIIAIEGYSPDPKNPRFNINESSKK